MRLIFKWLAQVFTVIAALLSGSFTLIDLLQLQVAEDTFGIFGLTIQGQKSNVEFGIRLALSMSAVALIALTDILDIAMPRRAMREVRDNYLKVNAPSFQRVLQPSQIRISIWYTKRPWYWPFWKIFEPIWSDGFEPPYDRALTVRLASWQGISGQAYRSGKLARLPAISPNWTFGEKYLMLNTFRMTASQLEKTKEIKGMLSIPMLLDRGKGKSQKAVGIINLDSVTDTGEGKLRTNDPDLESFFGNHGKILAFMNR